MELNKLMGDNRVTFLLQQDLEISFGVFGDISAAGVMKWRQSEGRELHSGRRMREKSGEDVQEEEQIQKSPGRAKTSTKQLISAHVTHTCSIYRPLGLENICYFLFQIHSNPCRTFPVIFFKNKQINAGGHVTSLARVTNDLALHL